MIVERHTNTAKPGCKGELVKLLKSWVEIGGLTPRVYAPTYGQDDTVVFYLDFETEQDQQEFWARLTSAKEHGENWEKWNELRVPGSHIRELYKLL